MIMEHKNEFEAFGKQMPYKVPEGFFDTVTQKTLKLAHKRKIQSVKRRLNFSLAAAASIIVAIVGGWLIFGETPEDQHTAISYSMEEIDWPEVSENPAESVIMDSLPPNHAESQPKQETLPTEITATDNPEDLDLLLKLLTDEELKILAEGLLMDIYVDDLNNEEI
jgi:hypothetical protein